MRSPPQGTDRHPCHNRKTLMGKHGLTSARDGRRTPVPPRARGASFRTLSTSGAAVLAAAGLMLTVALPAQAAEIALAPLAAETTEHLEAQTLAIAASVSAPVIVRDAISVTSPQPVVIDSAPVPAPVSASMTDAGTAAAADSRTTDDAEATPATTITTESSALTPRPVRAYPGQAVLDYADTFVGVVPYGSGNDPNDSFAYDGYTQYVLAAFGIDLPRGAFNQSQMGTQISMSEAQAGDLLSWPEGHIGFYDGNGGMYDSPDCGRTVQHRDTITWATLS